MRKAFILLTILMQIFVLGYMAGEREHILRNGRIIYLRTAPIDPRDLFRGDYVRLNYEISNISAHSLPQEGSNRLFKGQKVYVSLKESSYGLYEFEKISFKNPEVGIYLAGRSLYDYRHHKLVQPLRLNYGIEAYFVQQGKGLEIEKRRGSRNKIQIPLEMQIAVSANGKSVIKSHRWSPIGVGLQVLRSPPPDNRRSTEPLSAKVALTLANVSDTPLAIVTLPDSCSFSLETSQVARNQWTVAGSPCRPRQPNDEHVLVLQPREEKIFEFDFSDERWLVQSERSQALEIGTLDWSEQFRLIYRPPDGATCAHLKNRDLIWHGYLPSRAFHGRGRID